VRLIVHERTDQQQGHVFSYISPEQRVRKDHPLRPIRTMADGTLKIDWIFTFACAVYNLVRLRNLMRSAFRA
jgi:hypothetical protein